MDISSQIINFLNQKWLPNLVGLTGGILGSIAFVDNYLINFKPKIFVGTRVVLHFVEEGTAKQNLNSIICSLEICNHRKKYGVIYNLAARIYRADAINPPAVIYYATETLNKIPIEIQQLQNEEQLSYTPLTILPNSNKSLNLVFESTRFSKMHTGAADGFHLELLYQLKPKGKWHLIDKIYLYNDVIVGEVEKVYHKYIALENELNKDKLDKEIWPHKTSLYTGIYQRHINMKFRLYYYKLVAYPYKAIRDAFIAFPFYGRLLKDYLIDTFIKLPLIRSQGKSLLNRNVIKFNNPELRPYTNNVFELLYSYLDVLVKEINEGANRDALISLSKQDGRIILSRYRLSIKCYVSGDTSIQVQEENSLGESKVSYRLQFKEGLWNKKYWVLENYGVVSIKSFAIRMLDTLILHSNTR